MLKKSFDILPRGWKWAKIKDIGEVITGKTPRKSEIENYGNDYPFFKPPDLNKGFFVKTSEDGLSNIGIQKVRKLPPKSILVTCIGATMGKTGFIRVEGASNQQINAILPNKGIFPEYLYFLCHSPQFQDNLKKNASATTVPIINKTRFENLITPIAPFEMQKKIVIKIEELFIKLDYGIKLLKTIKFQLKQYRQSVLKYAFEGKLTKDWRKVHEDSVESASIFLEELIEERKIKIKNNREKFKILSSLDSSNFKYLPEEWEITKLGNILTFLYGKGLRKDKRDENGNYPVYGSNGIIGHHSSYLISEDCLIIGRKGSVGCVHLSNLPCWPIDTTYYVIPPLNINIRFIFYLIKSLNLEFLDKSTAIPGLNRNDIYSKFIPFPPRTEQNKIAEEIDKHSSYTEVILKHIKDNLKKAKNLRQSILKNAFEGKLIGEGLESKFQNNKKNNLNNIKVNKKDLKQKKLIDYVK